MSAHYAAQDVPALLQKHNIVDVDVHFRESMYSPVSGAQLLEPVDELNSLIDVVGSLTPARGLVISTKARPYAQRTMLSC